ncbi:MAG: tRNA preQ1(34) S-adenosylmethionine ribosyltransferase-isomerase QueA [Lachnospiraceae bacterium]
MESLSTHDFYYDLPQELIAQEPLNDRAASRLMCINRNTGEYSHETFRDIIKYLNKGDCLVINDTKVIPARLFGVRETEEGELLTGRIEVLLLKRLKNNIWETLVKPGKKCRIGTRLSFGDGLLKGTVLDVVEEGNRLIQFSFDGIFEEILDKLGQMPLPPYITRELKDKNRYQTVYAKNEGSAAAPTAGLHFTRELLKEIEDKGITIAHVTLHVGLGTFRPVKADKITEHHMHSELIIVEKEEAMKINYAKQEGGRVIAVGTTSCRTLESMTDENGILCSGSKWTDIFIYPGYKFKMIDGLITNFHLPESTLLMLVSAFAGKDNVMRAYGEAVRERYRFFSFGDAMLLI